MKQVKKILQFGLILLVMYVPFSIYAEDNESDEPLEPSYTEEDGSELRREPFIVEQNVFSSVESIVNEDASFSGDNLGEETALNLISPEILMPDQNDSFFRTRDFILEITEDDAVEHIVSSSWHTVDYRKFNTIHLEFNLEEGEQIVIYDAQNFYLEIANSNEMDLVENSFNDWLMIPMTNEILIEVVTNGNGIPPGIIQVYSVGTYSLPNMLADGVTDKGFQALNDESEKYLWILKNTSTKSASTFDNLIFMNSLVLESEKILSELEDMETVWDGMNWDYLTDSYDIEGNPGQEYYPDSTWISTQSGRSMDALLAYLHGTGNSVNKLLINEDFSPAEENFEDLPAEENDSRQYVLLSDWVKYNLEQWLVNEFEYDVNIIPHEPAIIENDVCTSAYNCPYSPYFQTYENLAYPWLAERNLEEPDIELPDELDKGMVVFNIGEPSGGEAGEAGVPLLTLYNSKTVPEGQDPQNVLLMEYHDEDITTFGEETDVQNVATPIIVNDSNCC